MWMYIFSEMTKIQLIINSCGHWKWNIYQDGDVEITLVDRNLRYEDLLSTVHEIVKADRNSFVYEMRYLLNAFGKTIKFKIKNDKNVQFAIEKANGIPEVYVIIKLCQQSSQQPSQSLYEPIHQMLDRQDSFVQLMTA